jgi:predicted RNA-binding protein YlxR (DUF448 family)
VVRGPDGSVTVDSTGHAPGRGAYLHATEACVRLARRNRAVERALRLEGKEAARLMEELALPSGDAR